MYNRVSHQGLRSRRSRLLASALATAALAAATGITAGQSYAARSQEAGDARAMPGWAKLQQPKLRHGELRVKGTRASERIALRLAAGAPAVLQVDIGDDGSAEFSIARAEVAKIAVDARSGDDLVRIDDANGTFTDTIPTSVQGGRGDDRLAGGAGAETLRGGSGDDSLDGNGGADTAFLGSGDDTFVWDPGDGSDVVEGEHGWDTMVFNGSGASEEFTLSANGQRLDFLRNVGGIRMDTAGVERVDVAALGGADLVTVDDLSRTAVRSVNADLAGALGGAVGDTQLDRVVVNGTNGNDRIDVSGNADRSQASGLAATVGIVHSEKGDRLEINTLEGRDSVDAGALAPGALELLVDGVIVP